MSLLPPRSEMCAQIAKAALVKLNPGTASAATVNEVAGNFADARGKGHGDLYQSYLDAFNEVIPRIKAPSKEVQAANQSLQTKLKNLQNRVVDLSKSNGSPGQERECVRDFQQFLKQFGSYIPDERFWMDKDEAGTLEKVRIILSADSQSEDDLGRALDAIISFKTGDGNAFRLIKFLCDYAWYGEMLLQKLQNPTPENLRVAETLVNDYGCGPLGTMMEKYLAKIGNPLKSQ